MFELTEKVDYGMMPEPLGFYRSGFSDFPGIVGGFNHLISCWASGMNHSWLFVRVRYLSVG